MCVKPSSSTRWPYARTAPASPPSSVWGNTTPTRMSEPSVSADNHREVRRPNESADSRPTHAASQRGRAQTHRSGGTRCSPMVVCAECDGRPWCPPRRPGLACRLRAASRRRARRWHDDGGGHPRDGLRAGSGLQGAVHGWWKHRGGRAPRRHCSTIPNIHACKNFSPRCCSRRGRRRVRSGRPSRRKG